MTAAATAEQTAVKPVALVVKPETIPQYLKDLPHWVVWIYKFREDKGKWTKSPYRADRRGKAKSNDPATWTSFDEALAAYRKGGFDGIGIALGEKLDLVGVDLDHCIDPRTYAFEPWALEIIGQFKSYTEASPSGTGVRIFLAGKLPAGERKNGNIEIYSTGRYLTVTGRVLKHAAHSIEPRQAEIDAFLAKHFPPEPKPERPPAGANGNGHTHLSDHEILELAKAQGTAPR